VSHIRNRDTISYDDDMIKQRYYGAQREGYILWILLYFISISRYLIVCVACFCL